jgi:hypothetical protein
LLLQEEVEAEQRMEAAEELGDFVQQLQQQVELGH